MPDTLTPKPDNGEGGDSPEKQDKKRKLPDAARPYMFQKGKSGNPGGRRNGSVSLKKLLIKLLNEKNAQDAKGRKNAEIFIHNELARGIKGDKDARKMIWEYVEGMPDANVNVNAQGDFTVVLTTRNGDKPESDV
jgi:hypothetical protein